VYITESAAIAERLQRQFPIHADQVHVVPNRPHPVFCETPIMSAPTQRDDELHLVYPARAYTHKNIDLIGPAGEIYAAKTGGRVVLHTTLRDLELRGLTPSASRWVQNHGELTPKALLDYYALADASFFPSMLESSSATPLEANVLGIPLIACDRDFVRLNATAAAVFDPFDAHSAAEALIAFAGRRDAARAEARRVAENYREILGRTSRTGDYLSIVAGELERLRAAPQRSVA
jgi:glycosyltransferase involved in cell wall biosynthesis